MSYAVSADGNGISRNFDEVLTEASEELNHYVTDGDENRPKYEQSADTLGLNLAKRTLDQRGIELDPGDGRHAALLTKCIERAREHMMRRVTDEATMYPSHTRRTAAGKEFTPAQPVYLDLGKSSVADELGRNWALPLPAIFFAELDPIRDSSWEEGKCEAIAVYHDPSLAPAAGSEDDDGYVWRTFTWNDRVTAVPRDWYAGCYDGIVRTFGSVLEMRRARARLVHAIKTIHEDAPSDRHDDEAGHPSDNDPYDEIEPIDYGI